jgi:hypothetical protein
MAIVSVKAYTVDGETIHETVVKSEKEARKE